MKINVDEMIQQLLPWELSLSVGGKEYAVRPLTVADMASMQAMQSRSVEEQMKLVASLFDGEEKPDTMSWQPETLAVVMGQIGQYTKDRAEKNSPILARLAGKPAGNLPTTPSSSPPL